MPYGLGCVLSWSLLLPFTGVAFSQSYCVHDTALHVVHLGVNDGLSQSSVLSIAQDKHGFMWFGTRNGLNKYDTRAFDIYRQEVGGPVSLLSNDYISSLLSDEQNVLWIGSVAGLTKYKPAEDRFEHLVHQGDTDGSISANQVNSIVNVANGDIWVGTSNGLNLLVDREANVFEKFFLGQHIYELAGHTDGKQLWVGSNQGLSLLTPRAEGYSVRAFPKFSDFLESLPSGNITSMTEDFQGTLWIGLRSEGMVALDIASGHFQHYVEGELGLPSNNIRKIIADRNGQLWVGTLKGLCIIDPSARTSRTHQHKPDDPYSLSQNSIYDIYEDRQGIIWIGTYYGGVSVIFPQTTPFRTLRGSEFYSSLSSNVVSAIVEDDNGGLWIGTEAEGLNYYNRSEQVFRHYRYEYGNADNISSNLIKAIHVDRNQRVWIGTFAGGLNVFDPQTGVFRHYENKGGSELNLTNNIYSLLEDSQGRFWVGTNQGIYTFDKGQGTFRPFGDRLASLVIQCLLEDELGNVWAGTSRGLFRLGKEGGHDFNPVEGTNAYVYCLYRDDNGHVWAGTSQHGLYRYDPHSLAATQYNQANGLPGNAIHGILIDGANQVWLSSNNGIYKLDPETNETQHYTVRDGLPGNEFNYNSYYKDSQGELFFGSLNGLVSFYPEQIAINDYVPDVVFTGLRLFNKPVKVNDETGLLHRALNDIDQIVFKHSQNIFTIDFAVLNYIKPDKNQYAYRLDGFEKEWNYVDVPAATYTNLPDGHYTFMVKGANNDGLWNDTPVQLHIRVLPPLWRTWWAYLVYFLLFVAISLTFMRYLIIRALLKKEHEEHQAKLRFFSYISHEIRTPITLVLAPLEHLLERVKDTPSLYQQVLPIKNNAHRLLRLVNELMDFRKIETNNLALHVSESDVVAFAKEVMLAFEDIARVRDIKYTFVSDVDALRLYIDKAQLEKILFNLLSNAFKFAPEGGEVGLFIHQTRHGARIRITDNGPGIPKDKQERLFTDFYQVEDNGAGHLGSGIGLSLSRSIALLHGGELTVESRTASSARPGFTCFTLALQSGKDHLPPQTVFQTAEWQQAIIADPPMISAAEQSEQRYGTKSYTVLVAEDNQDLRMFLVSALANQYRVLGCSDGMEAWETATDTLPDLVLSDVMMPKMDGLELCRKLKLDERTSHIPVILLTAMGTIEHQLSGLETGADAYVVKPFSVQLLKLTLRNLIASKEAMRVKFGKGFDLELSRTGGSRTDEVFLKKILAIIAANMDRADFDVSFLAAEVGMSQPVLYKKIKAITDLSVNNFIKAVRMKTAAKLMDEGSGSIAEVAYAVGFSDRKYFSKEFKRMFGKSPSEYVKDSLP